MGNYGVPLLRSLWQSTADLSTGYFEWRAFLSFFLSTLTMVRSNNAVDHIGYSRGILENIVAWRGNEEIGKL